jgi:hypothetical protein
MEIEMKKSLKEQIADLQHLADIAIKNNYLLEGRVEKLESRKPTIQLQIIDDKKIPAIRLQVMEVKEN